LYPALARKVWRQLDLPPAEVLRQLYLPPAEVLRQLDLPPAEVLRQLDLPPAEVWRQLVDPRPGTPPGSDQGCSCCNFSSPFAAGFLGLKFNEFKFNVSQL